MLRRHRLVLVALVSAAIVTSSLLPSTPRAEHWSQGNIYDEANYWLVERDVVRVCDQSDLVAAVPPTPPPLSEEERREQKLQVKLNEPDLSSPVPYPREMPLHGKTITLPPGATSYTRLLSREHMYEVIERGKSEVWIDVHTGTVVK